jgi:protein-S-isoprenylcysteine O-methyltransferase Ste14
MGAEKVTSALNTMRSLELKIPPPLAALLLAVMMWLTPSFAGVLDVPFAMRVALAVALVLCGLIISVSGIVQFRRARTTINPIKASASTSLVCNGVYRFTRNPMYVGLFLSLLGWAVYLSNPLSLIFLLVYVWFIARFQIMPEERILLELFGEPYAAYMKRVRRWV